MVQVKNRQWYLECVLDRTIPSTIYTTPDFIVSTRWPISQFRYFYQNVGRDWAWFEMNLLSDQDLEEYLSHRYQFTFLDYGALAGFALMKQDRDTRKVELSYFGMLPHQVGNRSGSYFMQKLQSFAVHVLDMQIMTVCTCIFDSKAALPCYKRNGFKILQDRTYLDEFPQDVVDHYMSVHGKLPEPLDFGLSKV